MKWLIDGVNTRQLDRFEKRVCAESTVTRTARTRSVEPVTPTESTQASNRPGPLGLAGRRPAGAGGLRSNLGQSVAGKVVRIKAVSDSGTEERAAQVSSELVQRLQAAHRDLRLPAEQNTLYRFDLVTLDGFSYILRDQ